MQGLGLIHYPTFALIVSLAYKYCQRFAYLLFTIIYAISNAYTERGHVAVGVRNRLAVRFRGIFWQYGHFRLEQV